MAELEVRVETLEGTAADHGTRISAAELNINGKAFMHLHCVLSPDVSIICICICIRTGIFQIWKKLLLTMRPD